MSAEDAQLPWDAFLTKAQQSWLTFAGGDELNKQRKVLAERIANLRTTIEILGQQFDPRSMEKHYDIVSMVTALVFSVKICVAIPAHSKSEAMLRRYAKAQKAKVAEEAPQVRLSLVFAAILAKIEASLLV